MSFKELFGDTLIGKSGDVQTDALDGKTVMLYFSAHWCPPCRGFTPKLADFYNKHKDSKNFEVVFVTGDNDTDQFEEYYNEMPWLALPFGSEQIDKLNTKYEVQGIPSLIILDSQGQTITKKGRQQVMSDPNAESFPWQPKPFHEIIAGPLLRSNKDSSTIQYSEIKAKFVGIYFSAHWCPPCRNFTPLLAEFYTKHKEEKDLEIIFSSRDKDDKSFEEYYGEMPWLSFPFKDPRVSELADLFELEGIPFLVILDDQGKIVCSDGTERLREDPEGTDFPWAPKPVYRYAEGVFRRHLLSSAVLLAKFTKEEAEKVLSQLTEIVGGLSTKEKEIHVFLFTEADKNESKMLQRIFELATVGDKAEIVLLNIPQRTKFESAEQATPDSIQRLLADFASDKLQFSSIA